MSSSEKLFGGVEGGASHTKFLLVSSSGKVIAQTEGKGTNQYLIGIDACLQIIANLVRDGLKDAGYAEDTTLEGLGLSLSGGDDSTVQEELKTCLRSDFPSLATHLYISSDTHSALAAAFPNGGVVMIAGTGSNCELINPDGTKSRCGGWGHMIGDEASATWISLRAIKTFYDHEDGFVVSPHSVEEVKLAVYRHFQIENRYGLLPYLYQDFNKAKLGGLCKELAKVYEEKKDPLIGSLFAAAGTMVARHLLGIAADIQEELKSGEGGVPVLCQGSVFKSWTFMEQGFVEEMTRHMSTSEIKRVTLKQLRVQAGLGAAALAARLAGQELPFDYDSHSTVMCRKCFTS